MKTEILLCVALEQELDPTELPQNVKILYTKVGKINATFSLTQEIYIHRPELILNFGSAGSLGENINGLCIINKVMQRDMVTEPLEVRGTTPFDATPAILTSDIGEFRCATGDSFVTSGDLWFKTNSIDLVDMELFAIAKVGHELGIPWRSAKFVTDQADNSAGQSWQENLKDASKAFYANIEELIN